ncbi:MAG: Hsp20/alpha crystallin family protein [Tateyamaria sp.]
MPNSNLPGSFSGLHPSFFQPFQREMAQMLDHLRGMAVPQPTESSTALVPAIDVAETADGLEITADVPGVAVEDLDVSVHGDTLVIKGQKTSNREEQDKDYQLVERSYGSFRRHVSLGFVPEAGAVRADFSNGVLTLHIDRPDTASPDVQKIDIGTS